MTFRTSIRFIALAFLIALPILPFVTHGALVPCGNNGPDCTLSDLATLANNIMNFLIKLCIAIFVVGLAVVGFKFITANGDPKVLSEAKAMLKPMLWGFLLILCSFLLIKLLLSIFAKPEFSRYVSMLY